MQADKLLEASEVLEQLCSAFIDLPESEREESRMKKPPTAPSDHDKLVAQLIVGCTRPVRKEVLEILEIFWKVATHGQPVDPAAAATLEAAAARVERVALAALARVMADQRFKKSLHADRARVVARVKSQISKPLNDAIDAAIRGKPKASTKEIIKLLAVDGTLTERTDGKYVDAHTGRPLAHTTLVSRISRRRKKLRNA